MWVRDGRGEPEHVSIHSCCCYYYYYTNAGEKTMYYFPCKVHMAWRSYILQTRRNTGGGLESGSSGRVRRVSKNVRCGQDCVKILSACRWLGRREVSSPGHSLSLWNPLHNSTDSLCIAGLILGRPGARVDNMDFFTCPSTTGIRIHRSSHSLSTLLPSLSNSNPKRTLRQSCFLFLLWNTRSSNLHIRFLSSPVPILSPFIHTHAHMYRHTHIAPTVLLPCYQYISYFLYHLSLFLPPPFLPLSPYTLPSSISVYRALKTHLSRNSLFSDAVDSRNYPFSLACLN